MLCPFFSTTKKISLAEECIKLNCFEINSNCLIISSILGSSFNLIVLIKHSLNNEPNLTAASFSIIESPKLIIFVTAFLLYKLPISLKTANFHILELFGN